MTLPRPAGVRGRRIGWILFGPAGLVVQLALGLAAVVLLVSAPDLRPTFEDGFIVDTPLPAMLAAGRDRNRRRTAARGRPRAGRRPLRRAQPNVHQPPALRDRLSDGPHRTVGAPATAAGRTDRCRNDFGRRHPGTPAGRRAVSAGGHAPAGTGGRPRPGPAQGHRPGLPDRDLHAHRRLRTVRVGHPEPQSLGHQGCGRAGGVAPRDRSTTVDCSPPPAGAK